MDTAYSVVRMALLTKGVWAQRFRLTTDLRGQRLAQMRLTCMARGVDNATRQRATWGRSPPRRARDGDIPRPTPYTILRVFEKNQAAEGRGFPAALFSKKSGGSRAVLPDCAVLRFAKNAEKGSAYRGLRSLCIKKGKSG